MKFKRIILLIEAGLILTFCIAFVRMAGAAQKTLVVTSSEQRIDYGNRVLFYKGEVRASWEDMLLEADEMEVYLTEENNLKEIIARGNVIVFQEEKNRSVEGTMATYTIEDNVLVVEGEAHYKDELGNDLQAQKITIWIGTEKLEAEGTPVKAIYVLEELEEKKTSGSTGG